MKDARFKLKIRSFMVVVLTFVFGLNVNAQKITVSGIVKDAAGEPIIGASVIEKGTTNGITSNFNGEYTLSVPSNATLVVSYVGYKTQEIPVNGQKQINVTLEEDARVLGEVVAIGYGTVKKNDATGSVTAIKPEEMNKGLTLNPQDMLVGKVAGVVVTPTDGTPGGAATIRIRGGSSITASNDPLIVIDGLPLDNDGIKGVANFLSTINPNDIESFTVLKDASATAIYGSRASNGVVLITTKKGKAGKPTISYNGSATVSVVDKTLDVMTGDEYRNYVTKLYGVGSTAVNLLGKANTDWQNQIYQTALSNDHSLSITGGVKNMPYRVNLGYTNQNGIIKTSNMQRYTGSLSLSPSLFDDHLKMNFNLRGMYVENRYADTGVIGSAASFDPTQSVYDLNEPYSNIFGGYWQWTQYSSSLGTIGNSLSAKNPLGTLMQKDDRAKSNDLIGNAEFDYKVHFLPDLRLHLMLGMERAYGKQTTYVSPEAASNLFYGSYGYEEKYKTNKQLSYYMQYAKELGIHKIDIMGGYEWQHFYNDGKNAYGAVNDTIVGAVDNTKHGYSGASSSSWAGESYLVSFFGRANYNLADQLLLTFTLRNDGSSKFSAENRWGLFPSAALAWKINETFLKNNNKINELKLRLGYGVTGQQAVSGNNDYMPTYYSSQTGAYYPFGSTYFTSWKPNAYNPKIKWEETTTYNLGLDLGLWNNRVTSNVDVYYRPTKDLLFTAPIAAGSNFSNVVLQNVGSLYNKGIEFSLGGKPISTKDVTWDITYTFNYNYNEVTKISSSASKILVGSISSGTGNYISAIATGYPAYSFYVYQQVYDTNGKPIEGLFVDRNGDGIINDDDRYYYHHAAPDFTMGLSSKLIYKQFDFGVTFHSQIGNYVYNDVAASKANIGTSGVYSTSGFLSNVALSALETNFTGKTNTYFSDYYIQNASFVKIDNITVGYSFKNLFKVIKDGRISLTMQNVATFTKYTGLDPEAKYNDGIPGLDKNIYPRPIQSVLGLSLNF